jgi:thiol:disulfide interchange protein
MLRRVRTAALWLYVALSGCAARQRATPAPLPLAPPPPPPASGTGAAPVAPAELAGIVFIEDDYARALAVARARHLPLFVDAWATWCHTCLSMKSYVFPDPTLRGFASRFVWLSVDTEREENATLVSRLGVRVLPTFYVIEPSSERAVVAWPGSLTAPELAELLEEADDTLWPEFQQLSSAIRGYIDQLTDRVVADVIHGDASDVDERPEPRQLTGAPTKVQD